MINDFKTFNYAVVAVGHRQLDSYIALLNNLGAVYMEAGLARLPSCLGKRDGFVMCS